MRRFTAEIDITYYFQRAAAAIYDADYFRHYFGRRLEIS